MGKEEFNNTVKTAVTRKVNKLMKKTLREGGGAPPSPNNTRNGGNGKNKKPKAKRVSRQQHLQTKKQQEKERTARKRNPY